MALHDRLTEFRKQSGISQMEAAEALDVSRQAISRWETGAARPSTENLIALARLYGVPLDELVNGEDPAQAGPAAAEAVLEAPGRKRIRLWLAAAALVLAVLAAIIGAYLLGRGESDDNAIDNAIKIIEIIKEDDLQEEVIQDFEDIGSVPWEKE